MIISKTPLRISFFGGGTDYPAWYQENEGAVLATTIDKYIYITCRHLPPFFQHKFRIVWSLIELVKDICDIQHPAVRECLRHVGVEKGMEIHYDADLPSKSGLGSSSTFTVGLLNSLYALRGQEIAKRELAKTAIHVEQELLKENVGCQDQILASFGGLNLINFKKDHQFEINPVTLSPERLSQLQDNLMLIFTGFTRFASELGEEWVNQASQKRKEYKMLHELVPEAIKILDSQSELSQFGRLLDEGWRIKHSLFKKISNPVIDQAYDQMRKLGAQGGKLLGAGGGGFLLIYAEPEVQKKIRSRLNKFLDIPFNFETLGSQTIFSGLKS